MHHNFHVFALLWYFNVPFHVRMMYLPISSKKPDSLDKTLYKSYLNSQVHVPKVFHLGMFVSWLIIYDQIVMAAILLLFYQI